MKIKILYEDTNILAIDKPSGISVHPDGRTRPASIRKGSPMRGGEKTLVDWILKNYPRMKNVGEPMLLKEKGEEIKILRPGIVHRLDKDTSGVLLLAKNQKTYEFLKAQFKNREIKKVYHAIVFGTMRDERGFINKPIGRSPNDFRKYLCGRGARGELKEATTFFQVLKRFEIKKVKFTYLEVRPKTGRTHQIRVHMKFLNHPVVCDSLYNADGICPKNISRMALHAKSIEFTDLKGKTIKVVSKIPKEFESLLK